MAESWAFQTSTQHFQDQLSMHHALCLSSRVSESLKKDPRLEWYVQSVYSPETTSMQGRPLYRWWPWEQVQLGEFQEVRSSLTWLVKQVTVTLVYFWLAEVTFPILPGQIWMCFKGIAETVLIWSLLWDTVAKTGLVHALSLSLLSRVLLTALFKKLKLRPGL